ncbi:MAG TPA: tetratricopeptide repeat protein [Polyangiaceae bacterium]|nr:tetratricopeptide repeat protein [Polyangiaceae bacterium]
MTRRNRRFAALSASLIALATAAPALAVGNDVSTSSAAASAAPGKREPRAERQLGTVARPTVKKKDEAAAKEKRKGRVSMQIPENLREILEHKIDRRIDRDVELTKKLRLEATGLLLKFVEETPKDAPDMPEALLRLGELEWENARDAFLEQFKRWEAAPAEYRGPTPEPNYQKSRQRFLTVLREYKTYREYDLALYIDGFLATEMGKHEEALDRFNKILAWFPKSRFVPDAHMVRAEYEFVKDNPDYSHAYQEYEEVLKHKDSDLYDIALFKSAWCLWRLGQTDEAARRFLVVFKTTAEAGSGVSAKRRAELDELQAEALKNLVAVFVEDEKNSAEDMYGFLKKAGGEKFAGEIVSALANAFYEQSQYERGIEAYRLLLKLEPMSPKAYEHGLAIAQGMSTMQLWEPLDVQYKDVIQRFTVPVVTPGAPPPQPSAWARGQTNETLRAAEDAIEKQLRQDAVSLHAKAQADKTSKVEYAAAAHLYETYTSRFASRPDAYDMYFNLGEIYFYHLGDDTRAADAYLAAVRTKPNGPVSRDALYNALAALETSREKELEANKLAGRKQAESPTDKKLTEAMELYVRTYPNDKEVPELLFRQGKLYYDYEVFDPAVRQWGLLLEKFPSSQFAAPAGELILDSFNKSKDYSNIETWARRLKTAPAFQSSAQQTRLNTLIVQAVFKQGEQKAEAGDHAGAAAAYLRAAREFPTEPRAAQAAVNAEVEARKGGDFETLAAAATLLVQNHSQRDEAPQGVWLAAQAFQSVGLFSEAADYHETIAEKWPRFEHHKDAAYNAVLLRTTVGEHDKAIADGNAYIRKYPRAEDADEVTFLMGKAHEKAEKWRDAEQLYARYAQSGRGQSGRVEAFVRLATVRLHSQDERGAEAALGSAMQIYRTYKRSLDDEGKYFAAKAHYMQGERILADFDKIKIEGEVEQLKGRLKKKSELLKKAADAFLETAEMGVAEWTTASLYQIGVTYESFSKALLDSPPPPTLSAEQKDLYSQQIDEFVVPIEEKSLEAYESGWRKAIELGIFNQWTAKMREALGRLNTELYPPLKEVGFSIRSNGPSPLPPLITAPRRGSDGRSVTYLMPAPPAGKDAKDKDAKSDSSGGGR